MTVGDDFLSPDVRTECERVIPKIEDVKPNDAAITYIFLKTHYIEPSSQSSNSTWNIKLLKDLYSGERHSWIRGMNHKSRIVVLETGCFSKYYTCIFYRLSQLTFCFTEEINPIIF